MTAASIEAADALLRVGDRHPTRLNTTALANQLLYIEKNRLTVTYKGSSQHHNDVGAVRSDRPVPLNRKVYYYEVSIVDSGEKGTISIGFAAGDFKLQRQPGWEPNSYGYHGENGHKFSASQTGMEFGPRFGTGDVIGAGIHLEKQQIFFTKNGKFMKVAFEGVRGELYPTIGLHSRNECVEVNFGQKPFVYDLDGMLQEEEAKLQSEIKGAHVSSGTVHCIVRRYLLHYGYASTLTAFDDFCGVDDRIQNPMDSIEMAELDLRKTLRHDIVQGRIDSVLRVLDEQYPKLITGSADIFDIRFTLYCQKFIELVKSGAIEEAIIFAKKDLYPFRDASPEYGMILREIIPLVAYPNPEESRMKYLFSAERREYVADVVNSAILKASPRGAKMLGHMREPISSMEKLLKQLVATHHQLHEENQNQGEVFNLRAHLF